MATRQVAHFSLTSEEAEYNLLATEKSSTATFVDLTRTLPTDTTTLEPRAVAGQLSCYLILI